MCALPTFRRAPLPLLAGPCQLVPRGKRRWPDRLRAALAHSVRSVRTLSPRGGAVARRKARVTAVSVRFGSRRRGLCATSRRSAGHDGRARDRARAQGVTARGPGLGGGRVTAHHHVDPADAAAPAVAAAEAIARHRREAARLEAAGTPGLDQPGHRIGCGRRAGGDGSIASIASIASSLIAPSSPRRSSSIAIRTRTASTPTAIAAARRSPAPPASTAIGGAGGGASLCEQRVRRRRAVKHRGRHAGIGRRQLTRWPIRPGRDRDRIALATLERHHGGEVIVGAGEALGRVDREAAGHDRLQRGRRRQLRRRVAKPRPRRAAVAREQLERVDLVSTERRPPGQHLEQDAGGRVEIRPPVDRTASGSSRSGRQVGRRRRAAMPARVSCSAAAPARAQQRGGAEVEDDRDVAVAVLARPARCRPA